MLHSENDTSTNVSTGLFNPLTQPGWDDLLTKFPQATIFHTSQWAQLLALSYPFRPHYMLLRRFGEVEGIFPTMEAKGLLGAKRGVSLPFSDYCDPLVKLDHSIKELFEISCEHARQLGWRHLKVRSRKSLGTDITPSSEFYVHVLDLKKDPIDLFRGFRDSTRRNIRIAQKRRIEVSFQRTREALQAFCCLNRDTRKRHGLPPQPIRFFDNLYTTIIESGLGEIGLAKIGKRAISASVFLYHGNRAYYKYGATAHEDLNTRAAYSLMWEAICHIVERGYISLCLGRTEKLDTGLRQFKSGWGADQMVAYNYVWDVRNMKAVRETIRTHGLHNCFFRSLPLNLSSIVGRMLYPYVA